MAWPYVVTLDSQYGRKFEACIVHSKKKGDHYLTLQFYPQGTEPYIEDGIINLIEKHLKEKDVIVAIDTDDNRVTEITRIETDIPDHHSDSPPMLRYIYMLLKEIGKLTKSGMTLSDAVDQLYDKPPHHDVDVARGDPRIPKYSFTREEAKDAIVEVLKVVLPRDQALSLAEAISEQLAFYPSRPEITGDAIHNRGTLDHDPLFKLVTDACAVIKCPDTADPKEQSKTEGKRKYAIGVISDVVEGLYKGPVEKKKLLAL